MKKSQQIRKGLILISLLLFPVTIYYFSPYLIIDGALDNYKRALKLRPNFPEAREYLGEAYIQAVLREIETLKANGKAGAEHREDLIKALKDAAESFK